MAEINPNLLLQIRPQIDVGRSFSNLLGNIGSLDNLRQQRELAPLKKQALESNFAEQAKQRKLKSLVTAAAQISPMLNAGDIEGAKQFTQRRIEDLERQGVDSSESKQFLGLLDSNPQLAAQRAGQAVQLGQKMGFFAGNTGLTNKQRELEQFRNLPEGTKEEKAFKKQFGQAIGAISKLQTVESKLNLASGKANIKTEQAVDQAQRLETETIGGKQKVQSKQLTIDETKIKNENAKKIAIDAKNIRREESEGAITLVKELLEGDSFSDAFGRLNNAPPEGLRTQANIDARAQVDRINGLLSLESRQKLKGSGTISDGEQKILGQSATILLNPLISDEVARKELRRVQRVFEDASDRNRLRQETRADQQNQPQVLQFDAQGNLIQ